MNARIEVVAAARGAVGTVAATLLAVAAAASQPQEPRDMAARIAAAPAHPRLCLDAAGEEALRRRLAADETLAGLERFLSARADAILAVGPAERELTGRRMLGVSRKVLGRVVCLAFVHRLTGERRYAVRAQEEMLAAAGFSDWNPSHFLDVAEMTAALAIGYDWLHAALEPAVRDRIRAAIVGLGLRPSLPGGSWVRTTNNWNQVCHGGLALGALAVLEHEPELAEQILTRAVKNLPRAMAEYAPHGGYPEGPGYWAYGTTYNVLLLDALQTALGDDFGLQQAAGFLRSADYYLHVTGPTGLWFNYSDCGSSGGVTPAMYWFAARRGEPTLLNHERAALRELLRQTSPAADTGDRLLPFVLIWARSIAGGDTPLVPPVHFRADGATPVAVHRSGWDADATFVGVKGGSPGVNHAHMDIGTFVMDAQGTRWAEDLGAQNYNSLEQAGIDLWNRRQDSARWSVFRIGSLSHNTLVVDGKGQLVQGSAPIVESVAVGPRPHTIVDLSPVYVGQLAGAQRGVALLADRSVLIQDEVAAPDRAVTLRWGMVTRADVELDGSLALLRRGGRELTLRVVEPAGADLVVVDTATPRNAHDQPNPGTRMVAFEVELPAGSRRRLVVRMGPVAAETAAPAVLPLADW